MLKSCRIPHLGGLISSNVSSSVLNRLQPPCVVTSRTTYVLKRAYPLPLIRARQRKEPHITMIHYVYDIEQNHYDMLMKQKDIQVILVKYVEGLGKAGDIVTVNRNFAYNNLLLPKLAIYATPENVANVTSFKQSVEEEEYSSKTSKTLTRILPYHTIPIVLNKDVEWTIEPWHIRASARKIGIQILNESSIEIPGPPIRGPDPELHGKDFLVVLKVNNKEKIKMRCKIFIWASKAAERNAIENQFWCFRGDPVHPEEAEDLNLLPVEQFNSDKVNIPTQI